MEFDEKELRKEISYAIKNIHGVRQVETACKQHIVLQPSLFIPLLSCPATPCLFVSIQLYKDLQSSLSSGVSVCPVFQVSPFRALLSVFVFF